MHELRDQVAVHQRGPRNRAGDPLRFVAEGAFVVAVECDAASLESLQRECKPASLLAIEGDASTQAIVDEAVARALAARRRLDILVNNAVRYVERGVVDTTDLEWASTIDAALTAVPVVPRGAAADAGGRTWLDREHGLGQPAGCQSQPRGVHGGERSGPRADQTNRRGVRSARHSLQRHFAGPDHHRAHRRGSQRE
jgi:NAD(P)-dependent dehydrogenase (short-subunit alcohol dehydrogenase family)